MEVERQIRRHWGQKMVFLLIFGLFITAKAEAQLLGLGAPIITVQPVGTNVQNGDTVAFTTSAYCTLGDICAVTWVFNNGRLPTNATVTVTGLGTTTVSSTLTLNHASSASGAGTYSVEIEDELLVGLLGLTTATATSQNATLGIIPTVTPVAAGTGMANNGFNLEFAAPTGSNVVIQASSDLKTWVSISTNVVSGGVISYIDAAAKAHSNRFYRAKIQ